MQPITLPPSSNPRVPRADFPFRHHVPLQVRFNDIDAIGHVNNSVYFCFADLGKFRYMEDVLGKMDPGKVRAVIVNVGCDFFAPTKLDEPVEIVTAVESVGQRSIHVVQRVINSQTLETKCLIRTVLAGWDPSTGLSEPIPPEWLELMERFEQRPLVKCCQSFS